MNVTHEINNFYYHMSLYELQLMNGADYYNGLSYNSLLYLNVIEQMEDCTVSKITESLGITKSAVTLKVNELVRQGVVVREQSTADRRVHYLRLSESIGHVFSVYDKVFQKIERKLSEKYTEEQLKNFAEILHTISGYEWREMKNE